ncbi:hypothetical protein K439DRAFT_1639832 [Ramaria rubella]|nr:hypothetical protein K439DRAFT_1639832 [Ramaria rubella]
MPLAILVADSNLVGQKLTTYILKKYGHQIETVENGALAVDAFKQGIAEDIHLMLLL